MANLPTTITTILAEVVLRLSAESAAASTMAEGICNLEPGKLVLLREDNTTPLQWPTAIITETHPGKDGVVSVVTLKTSKGTLKRPITKICPLPRVINKL